MDKKENEADLKKWARVATVIILVLWSLTFLAFKFFNSAEERGTFGDMFGAVNALFSGLAFAGIIITIILQSRELKLQREELQETRKVFEEQSYLMSTQQKSAVFFNLLQNHRQLVESFNIGEWKLGSGNGFDEKINASYTEAISGYEVLKRIEQKWTTYFEIYSESYEMKRILDLELHNYPNFEALVNSDQITHVFFRELRNIHSYIDNILPEDSNFYKETLLHSLTSQEIFIFETLYSLFPDQRNSIIYNSSLYYNPSKYVDFKSCLLPTANAFIPGFDQDKLWLSIETTGTIESCKMFVFNTNNSNRNVTITDIVKVSIDNFGLTNVGLNQLDIDVASLLIASNLNIHTYPFYHQNSLNIHRIGFDTIIKINNNKFHFYFEYTFNINEHFKNSALRKYELRNPEVVQISNEDYYQIYQEIAGFNFNKRNEKPSRSILDRINEVIEIFFINNPTQSKIQAKKFMPLFVKAGVFDKNEKDGLPIRNLLRKLDDNNQLHKIPFVEVERKGNRRYWYFENK